MPRYSASQLPGCCTCGNCIRLNGVVPVSVCVPAFRDKLTIAT